MEALQMVYVVTCCSALSLYLNVAVEWITRQEIDMLGGTLAQRAQYQRQMNSRKFALMGEAKTAVEKTLTNALIMWVVRLIFAQMLAAEIRMATTCVTAIQAIGERLIESNVKRLMSVVKIHHYVIVEDARMSLEAIDVFVPKDLCLTPEQKVAKIKMNAKIPTSVLTEHVLTTWEVSNVNVLLI